MVDSRLYIIVSLLCDFVEEIFLKDNLGILDTSWDNKYATSYNHC